MLLVTSFLASYITWTIANVIPSRVCTISIQYGHGDLNEPQPLLLKQNGTHAAVWYPNDDTFFSSNAKLKIFMGDSIYLACPGENNYLIKKDGTDMAWGNMVEAVCVKDKMFEVNGIDQPFRSLVCKFPIKSTVEYMKNSFCPDGHRLIEIGFNVNSGDKNIFIPTIELCRDEETYTTYYTKFKMTKMIGTYQHYPRALRYKGGKFYYKIKNIDYLYSHKNQFNTFVKILKSIGLAKTRLKSQFLSRGHLAASGDFVYGTQQHSTFSYLNIVPQWNTFNQGNWNILEMSIRNFVTKYLDLDVYTGVHGQMTMKDIDDTQQPVYLDPENKLIPVPKFFWKVIYDPNSRRGTAFVGLNDPFIESITNDVYLCTPIKRNIIWNLNWKPRDIKAGISYVCSVADLQKAVSAVPQLDVINLLV